MNASLPSHAVLAGGADTAISGWRAGIELGFQSSTSRSADNIKTVLSHRRRFGPLAVQRPFYPEGDICHVYLLHPPGGIVGGDQLQIDVSVEAAASALITAPGATKFYRSLAEPAMVKARLDVAGELEWLPQENIVFRGAEVEQRSSINLHNHSRFVGWEIHCFGRPAAAERFDDGNALFATEIKRDGRPLQIDRLRVSPSNGRSGAASLRGFAVTATLYATPVDSALLRDLQDQFHRSGNAHCIGLTLIDNLLVARYLGPSARAGRQQLTDLWHQLRPEVIGRPAIVPRIWLT